MWKKLSIMPFVILAGVGIFPLSSLIVSQLAAAFPQLASDVVIPAFSVSYSVFVVAAGLFLLPRLAVQSGRAYLRTSMAWIFGALLFLVFSSFFITGAVPISPVGGLSILAAHLAFCAIILIVRQRWAYFVFALISASAICAAAFGRELAAFAEPLTIPRSFNEFQVALDIALSNGRGAIALLVFASLFSYAVLRSRIARVQNDWARAAQNFIWVAATHVVWLTAVFFAGLLDEFPRWLPFTTGVAMVFFVSICPLIVARLEGRLTLGSLIYNPSQVDDANAWGQLVRGDKKSARRAWIISYTGVSNEPRVLRQCAAMTAAGWELVVCGFDGHSPRPSEWNFVRIPSTDPFRPWFRKFLASIHKFALFLTVHARPRGLFKWSQHLVHATNPTWLQIRREVMRISRENLDLRPDLVVSHDYFTADLGYSLSREYDAKFSIDCHEYAVMQYSNDPMWVKHSQPVIRTVQDYYLRRADLVTVVGSSIADLIAKESRLKRPPIVVRNVSFKNKQSFRPVGERIKVLYHGDLSRPREIDMAIKSLPLWRKEFDLVLRGSGDPAYIGELKRLAERLGVESRVVFEPPVKFDQIVPAANSADIGYFAYRAYSPQIQFALPNKFFEYTMAGLAICVSDLREVGAIVRQCGNGLLIPEHTPESIAETINKFNQGNINEFKQASLAAADSLNWETESQLLVNGYQSLWTPNNGDAPPTSRVSRRDSALNQSIGGAQLGVAR